jgi:sialidase-1
VVSGRPTRAGGVFGHALDFAGDHVEVPLTESLSFDEGAFTAAVWFRTTASEDQAIFWAHATANGEPKWWIRLEPGQGRVNALIDTGAASRTVPVPGTFNDGEWHHVALTRNEEELVMYVDGVRGGSAGPVAGSVSDDARTGIRVGARVDGVNNPFRGRLDEVWLFDRALTADEVRALAAGNVAPAGAQLHLPLDQTYRHG